MRHITAAVSIVCLLAACAYKRTMPEEQYGSFALHRAATLKCAHLGRIDVDTASFGLAHLDALQASWTYDPLRMQQLDDSLRPQTPTQAQCTQMAITIAGWKRQVQAPNATAGSWQQFEPNNTGNNMSCVQAGVQTLCRKF